MCCLKKIFLGGSGIVSDEKKAKRYCDDLSKPFPTVPNGKSFTNGT